MVVVALLTGLLAGLTGWAQVDGVSRPEFQGPVLQDGAPVPPRPVPEPDQWSGGLEINAQPGAVDGDVDGDVDGEPLARGPIHEAFAERVDQDANVPPIIVRPPPQTVNELPPAIKPEGDDIQWISGYWAWDDEREDYIWVSGVWRKVPPGRRWEPGYWTEVEGGHQWISGTWVSADLIELAEVPPPPQNLDVGPSSPAPSSDRIWISGNWAFQNTQYAWRPGYWSTGYDDWVWVPERYLWTAGGYVHCTGYWDYPVTYRGFLYAPYRFYRPLYRNAGYRYTPRVLLRVGHVFAHIFVRPRYRHYYFGDYYPDRYRDYGYFPWHDYHRRHYSPLLAHYDHYHRRHGINYLHHREQAYDRFHKNPHLRPHHVVDKHYQHRIGSLHADAHGSGTARYRLDRPGQEGSRYLAARTAELKAGDRYPGSVRRTVQLHEQQQRAIGDIQRRETQRMVERRRNASREAIARGSVASQRPTAQSVLKPVAGDGWRQVGTGSVRVPSSRGNALRIEPDVRQRSVQSEGRSVQVGRPSLSRDSSTTERPNIYRSVSPSISQPRAGAPRVTIPRTTAPGNSTSRGPAPRISVPRTYSPRSSAPTIRIPSAGSSRGAVSRPAVSRPPTSRPATSRGGVSRSGSSGGGGSRSSGDGGGGSRGGEGGSRGGGGTRGRR